MKAALRELLTDLKAAILIGDSDSIQAAIDQIRAADDDELPPSALFPLGEVLTRLAPEEYLTLLGDDDAAVRGAAASAAALAWLDGKAVDRKAIIFAADDPVYEVRNALCQALSRSPAQAEVLAAEWLNADQESVQLSGLQLLARLPDAPEALVRQLEPLDAAPDQDFRAVLVETVNALGGTAQAEIILSILEKWSARTEPNVWVITRVFSASWAKAHPDRALAILRKLSETTGEIRAVLRAIERLEVK